MSYRTNVDFEINILLCFVADSYYAMKSTKFEPFQFHFTLYDIPNDFQINNENTQIRFELNFDIGYQKREIEKEQWGWHHFRLCTYVWRWRCKYV